MKVVGVAFVLVALLAVPSWAGINSFVRGSCEKEREWFCSVEFDEDSRPICMRGMRCDGEYYTTCNEVPKVQTKQPNSTITVQQSSLNLNVANALGQVTIHDVSTGQVIHDFGSQTGESRYDKSIVKSGLYILVTRNEGGQVVDSDLVMIP